MTEVLSEERDFSRLPHGIGRQTAMDALGGIAPFHGQLWRSPPDPSVAQPNR
jgi:hypothetical protein